MERKPKFSADFADCSMNVLIEDTLIKELGHFILYYIIIKLSNGK